MVLHFWSGGDVEVSGGGDGSSVEVVVAAALCGNLVVMAALIFSHSLL